ncbi:VTT domain-containing protein [Paenibacillus sp. LHD-117]|uniref:TVP38/TMEM64 family protein n=1 Tax=Paenibacillus sp. LHD-117 TaxID=3071412 RepID=UPI0027DF6614|nr:VTT domain-containing protein [Paenibacillus sp. LHD-117]MDQ6423072.1 VTT domain-containing protein [Paenibacillus sp. LHD-117]
MIKKGLVVLLYGVVIAAVIVYKEPLLSWLSLGGVERLPWMIGAAVLLAMIPVVPFGIVAGIIGAAYGPVWGSLINVATSTVAAALTFCAVRLIFQERSRQLMASLKGAERFIFLLERNAFFAVILARLLPFVPAVIVNIGAALFRMSFGSFIMATAVGKVPVMVVFAVMGDQLNSTG